MKLDIEYSNNIESVLKVLNNPDARKFCVWFTTINAICSEYKDKKSIDLVLKIYDITGLNFFLFEKHTYKELEDFYEQIQPVDIDKYVDFPDFSNLKDEPDEEVEEEVDVEEEEVDVEEESEEEEQEESEEQENSSTFAKESVSYDADITEDVKQRAEVIKTTNAKRAALKKMKPNV